MKNEQGNALTEVAVLIGFVSVLALTAVFDLSHQTTASFNATTNVMETSAGGDIATQDENEEKNKNRGGGEIR